MINHMAYLLIMLAHYRTRSDFGKIHELTSGNNDGKKVIVKFVVTNLKADASAWVTWVVRDLGEGRTWSCQYRTWCSRSCPW